jgi:hypothetical protein
MLAKYVLPGRCYRYSRVGPVRVDGPVEVVTPWYRKTMLAVTVVATGEKIRVQASSLHWLTPPVWTGGEWPENHAECAPVAVVGNTNGEKS